MKLKQILSELAQLEYSSTKGSQKQLSQSGIENKFLETVEAAIAANPELQKMFDVEQEPYDVQLERQGGNIKIILNPEHGQKQSIATFPMSYLSKYFNNPKGLISLLLKRG